MNTVSTTLALAGAAILAIAPARARTSIDVVAVAEQTNRGTLLIPPAAGRPAFYVAVDAGYIEAGDPIAGQMPPSPAAVGQALRMALASQGYDEATAHQAPSLLLVYSWGTICRSSFSPSSLTRISPNLRARVYLVAATPDAARAEEYLLDRKLARGVPGINPLARFASATVRDILDRAEDERYFVVVSAYDFEAATHGDPALLWRLKASARAVGTAMKETVPALIRDAGPYYGRNLAAAESFRAALDKSPAAAAKAAPATAPAAAGRLDPAFVRQLAAREHDFFAGEYVADPGGTAPRYPIEAPGVELPRDLRRQIAGYQRERLDLQEALFAELKKRPEGTDPAATIDAFRQANGPRISALARTRESIRDQLSRLAAANTNPSTAAPLNALLQEYATDVQQWAPPPAAGAP